MYTILMDTDKQLTISKRTKLYQKEKLVDKIQFLLLTEYEGIDLTQFTVSLKYVDQLGKSHAETLVKDEELYLGKIRCVLPVDTELNKEAGDVLVHLTLSHLDVENGKNYILHTGEVAVEISSVSELYSFDADAALEVADQMALEFEAKCKALELMGNAYNKNKADDIMLDKDNDVIYLMSEGQRIGSEIHLGELGEEISENTEDGLIDVIL